MASAIVCLQLLDYTVDTYEIIRTVDKNARAMKCRMFGACYGHDVVLYEMMEYCEVTSKREREREERVNYANNTDGIFPSRIFMDSLFMIVKNKKQSFILFVISF